MMASDHIFHVTELYMLKHFGIPDDQITWPRVTLSNNDLVCILHNESRSSSEESMYSSTSKDSHQNKVEIIHSSGKIVSRSKTIADSAKIHPSKPIIALKALTHFQVYNYDTKNLLNEVEVDNEVCFWKWANEESIMIITDTTVYQWNVFIEKSELEEICQRLPRLNYTEIVNCTVDDTQRWYTITGLIDHGKESLIEGITQVYSADYGVAQCIEAHTTTFITHKFDSNLYESVVMCTASRMLDSQNGKIHSIELGPAVIGNAVPRFSSSDLQFTSLTCKAEDQSSYIGRDVDFPVSMQADKNHNVVYIVTKYGKLFIAELESAVVLAATRISSSITFCSSLNSLSSITVVSRSTQVMNISIDWLALIKHTRNALNKPDIANRLQNSRGMENVDLIHIC